jgi:hypothetical protein
VTCPIIHVTVLTNPGVIKNGQSGGDPYTIQTSVCGSSIVIKSFLVKGDAFSSIHSEMQLVAARSLSYCMLHGSATFCVAEVQGWCGAVPTTRVSGRWRDLGENRVMRSWQRISSNSIQILTRRRQKPFRMLAAHSLWSSHRVRMLSFSLVQFWSDF